MLKSVEIKNYKSCLMTKFDLSVNPIALIGINGSGKTSILSAIRLLKIAFTERHIYRSHSKESLFETGIKAHFIVDDVSVLMRSVINYDFNSQTEEEVVDVETEWKIEGHENPKWYSIPIELLSGAPDYIFERSLQRKLSNKSRQIADYLSARKAFTQKQFSSIKAVVEYVRSINYYSATQFSNPQKCPTSVEMEERESKSSFRGFRINDSHGKYVLDVIKLQKENESKYSRYLNLIGPNGINLIDDLVFEELEFSSEEVSVKTGGTITKEKRKKIIVVPKITLGKKTLSFNQLSEGTFKTIALLFYAIQNENSLLLIEEPEVCVHHGLLKSVIEVIKNESNKKQILMSTHSDYVLDQLEPDNLVMVTRTNEKGTLARRVTKALSKNGYNALHQYLSEIGNLGEFWKEGGFDE